MTGLLYGVALLAMTQAAQAKVRSAAVAGSFYPADRAELTSMMDGMLAKARVPPMDGPLLALVAPHAGYPYSGPVAAHTYAVLKGQTYKRVVVISPSHYEAFGFSSIYEGDSYETPLGTVPIDKVFAARLAKADGSIKLSERGHAVSLHNEEHAIEVQLPWLQRVLGDFALVPIVMGDQSYASSRALGVALAKLISTADGGATLIVASSDLSHYHTYNQATQLDRKTLNAVQDWDYLNMSRNFQHHVWEACGGGAVVAAMIAAERLGANRAVLLNYANSGDVTGDKSRVVGYGAMAFVKGTQAAEERPFSLSDQEKAQLLAVARASVDQAVRDHRPYQPSEPPAGALSEERGAFVTITKDGELRGCIGYTDPVEPLYQVVRDTATLAASHDPRFPAVTVQELPKLEYEISVLSPLRHVRSVNEIQVGQHGILVRNGNREGLLLPQVATEQNWDRVTFLNHTCAKAGMRQECWREEGSDIFVFTALVFGEHLRGSSQ